MPPGRGPRRFFVPRVDALEAREVRAAAHVDIGVLGLVEVRRNPPPTEDSAYNVPQPFSPSLTISEAPLAQRNIYTTNYLPREITMGLRLDGYPEVTSNGTSSHDPDAAIALNFLVNEPGLPPNYLVGRAFFPRFEAADISFLDIRNGAPARLVVPLKRFGFTSDEDTIPTYRFHLQIRDDLLYSGPRTIAATLSDPTQGLEIARGTVPIVVLEDEQPPRLTRALALKQERGKYTQIELDISGQFGEAGKAELANPNRYAVHVWPKGVKARGKGKAVPIRQVVVFDGNDTANADLYLRGRPVLVTVVLKKAVTKAQTARFSMILDGIRDEVGNDLKAPTGSPYVAPL